MKRIVLMITVLMCMVCNAGCTNGNSKEMEVDDKACFDGEMIKYLSMSIQEILDLTNAEIDLLSSSVVFEPNVFFPYIETASFLIICRSMDTTYTPIYIMLYQDDEEKYLEMLQLNSDMNFQDIMEVMGTASVEESKERAGGYKRYMISFVSGELEYCFCSDTQDGRRFELFIGLASKMIDVEQSKSSEADKTD